MLKRSSQGGAVVHGRPALRGAGPLMAQAAGFNNPQMQADVTKVLSAKRFNDERSHPNAEARAIYSAPQLTSMRSIRPSRSALPW